MGLSSSSDEWCHHSDRIVEGFSWCKKIVDNILIWVAIPVELEEPLHTLLQRCQRLHVTLSRSKFQILDSRRIVLSLPAVKLIIRLLHASHSGINKMLSLARVLYFWTGMVNDIKQLVSTCPECTRLLQSQPSNPMVPSRPFFFFYPADPRGIT